MERNNINRIRNAAGILLVATGSFLVGCQNPTEKQINDAVDAKFTALATKPTLTVKEQIDAAVNATVTAIASGKNADATPCAPCAPEATVTPTATSTKEAIVTVTSEKAKGIVATAIPTKVDTAVAIKTATPKPANTATPVSQTELSSCGIKESVYATHEAIPVANLDATSPQGSWFRPVYNPEKADAAHNWEGIGPWAPIAFANVDKDAAYLKTHGNVGEFIVVGDKGGRINLSFMQEAQHQNETKMKPDGTLNPDFQNQYTISGLPANTEVTPFDPDTGKQLTWPDGSPINWATGPLGTFSVGLPNGEVRFGVCFVIPSQIAGVQHPEITVKRGPNDRPELTGENQLPNTPQVVKAIVPDK